LFSLISPAFTVSERVSADHTNNTAEIEIPESMLAQNFNPVRVVLKKKWSCLRCGAD
jgi:hypothetical protein